LIARLPPSSPPMTPLSDMPVAPPVPPRKSTSHPSSATGRMPSGGPSTTITSATTSARMAYRRDRSSAFPDILHPLTSVRLRRRRRHLATDLAHRRRRRVRHEPHVVHDRAELIAFLVAPERRLGAVRVHAGDPSLGAGH